MAFKKLIYRLVLVVIACFPGLSASAGHFPENLIEEVYREIWVPYCLYSNSNEGTSLDCENPDPTVYACWQEKLHVRYDEAGILALMEEISASNQKYPFYNEPFYNEFISNRNWDNLMYISDRC